MGPRLAAWFDASAHAGRLEVSPRASRSPGATIATPETPLTEADLCITAG
jgi:hypothetical protein